MVACETLPDLPDGSVISVLENHIQVTEAYRRCYERHRALSKWVDNLD